MLRTFHKLKNKPALSRWLFYLALAIALVAVWQTPIPPEGVAFLNAIERGAQHPLMLGQNHLIKALIAAFPVELSARILMILSVLIAAIAAEIRCNQKGIASINALLLLPVLISGPLLYGNFAATLSVGLFLLGFVVLDYRMHPALRTILASAVGVVVFVAYPPMLLGFIALVTIDFIVVRSPEKRLVVLGGALPLTAFLTLNNVTLPTIQPGFNLAAFNDVIIMPSKTLRNAWHVVIIALVFTEISRVKRWTYSGRSFAIAALLFLLVSLLFFEGNMRNNLWFFLVYVMLGMTLISELRKIWLRVLVLLFTIIWTATTMHRPHITQAKVGSEQASFLTPKDQPHRIALHNNTVYEQ